MSNRNSATEGVDPMETLLYSVFVANSESVGIGNLARVLNLDEREVRSAMSLACRLGFASRASTEVSQGSVGFFVSALLQLGFWDMMRPFFS